MLLSQICFLPFIFLFLFWFFFFALFCFVLFLFCFVLFLFFLGPFSAVFRLFRKPVGHHMIRLGIVNALFSKHSFPATRPETIPNGFSTTAYITA